MSNQIRETIVEVFDELATALETGNMGAKIKIGLTINGSEHGFEVMEHAAKTAQNNGVFEVVLIGDDVEWASDFEHYTAKTEQEVEDVLDKLFNDNVIQGCVTLHHTFPIGTSTVGRVIAPSNGKSMFIATTTGTTATVRAEAMVLNAINGIAAAKASGIKNPTVGILNVDGSNTVDRALHELQSNGYDITFGASQRSDGGSVLRGNDLLTGAVDVVVCDSLTGNILMKLFGAYTTGGSFESTGYGYGPGIGDGEKSNICIVSRASGGPVIANALQYAFEMAKGNLIEVSKNEYAAAKKAKLKDIREGLQPKQAAPAAEVKMPQKEIVTGQINGIDVLDLEDAVTALWSEGIYAESGMGCSGPIVMINEAKVDKATEVVKAKGFM